MSQAIPPQDLESERAVLGSILLSRAAIDEAQMILDPDQFYADAHSKICECCYHLHNGLKPVDPVTLGSELQRRGWFAEVGGETCIETICKTVPHAAHVGYYARLVLDTWVRREIIGKCSDTMQAAYDKGADTDELLERHDTATQRMLEVGVRNDTQMSIGDLLVKSLDTESETRGERFETGFRALDELTGGIYGGNLIVIAARASVGKTAAVLNMTLNMTKASIPVLMFSLEQGGLEVVERLLSIESGVEAHRMRRRNLDAMHQSALAEAQNVLHPLPLQIDDSGDQTVAQISARTRLARRRHKIKVVVIDYLQLITADDSRKNREEQVSRVSRGLKKLARSLSMPVIVLAQLNREVEKRHDKEPKLSDLRESGAVEQDADQVWMLHRPEYYDPEDRPGEADIYVRKNRNGPTGRVQMLWKAETMQFVDLPEEEERFRKQAMEFR